MVPGGRNGSGSGSVPQDLAGLPELDEELLLETLLSRFREQKIYTYIGDILIAINPFCTLPLYEKSVSEMYKNHDKSLLPPHIFAVAARAYEAMRGRWATGPQNQCIVISGESGAGKTENTKLLLRQIMELCRGNSQLEQQILQVNPLLEAFGNAQTVINDNSSRFGKYIQLRFSDSTVKGAKINEYLLEKSRVSHQDHGERNFHIFYYMFAGMSVADKEMFGILEPVLYRYINQTYGDEAQAAYWKEKYQGVCNSMDMVGFEEQEQVDMQTILAGILSLGNVVFEPQETGGVTVALCSHGWLKAVAGQFGVEEEELLNCLVRTVSVTRGESIQRLHTQQQAEDARDSIARMVYGRVFGWIVRKINELLAHTVLPDVELKEIGILDIFGFENFAVNHFEQFCINLANEQLQYFFNHHIFLMEQKEYELEGISWDTITFNNNKPILDLFLAKPMGILSLLDEQSAFPRATDATFVEKLNSNFKGHKNYETWRSRVPGFTIVHYAGKVQYTGCGFLEKNRDTLPGSIRTLFINSVTPLLSVLFTATVSRTGTLMPHQKGKITPLEEEKFNTSRKQSVGAQFRHSLVVLMEKMYSANPHFVRCIKPNGNKQPDVVDRKMILDQLRYNGLLETIRIRRDGFSWRPSFQDFTQRFGILLLKPALPLTMESCLSILQTTGLTDWKCGKSRLFFKYWHQEQLLKIVDRLNAAAVVIQKNYKTFQYRRMYQDLLQVLRDQKKKARQEEEAESAKNKKQREETENKGNSSLPSPVPVPRKRLPQSRTVPEGSPSQPPVPRPRSKLVMLTPFDNALTFGGGSLQQAQGEAERQRSRRTATLRWFKETQLRKVIANGNFPTWLHGMISRREAEDLLSGKPQGCFMIRISQTREGYTLTYRGKNCCRHYMIDMQPNGRYVILGEDRAHVSLTNLLHYHKTVGIKPYMETLTEPCGQKSEWEPDYEELKFLTKTLSLKDEEQGEDSMHSKDQKGVSMTMAELFIPPHSIHAEEAKLSPSLKRIQAKKQKSNKQWCTEGKDDGRNLELDVGRALPRLYPSI
ncbi:myosin-IIIa [Microcaecilia unicolor]|uniref:Myosin-IIIa-like n=1 Tax=Microcaecilia unicolor TaxID=1415580 RepID=A0A6P7X826_9AMPH|nr:myosin-IIIa-like [Microcaecilia unicolor]